MQYLLYKVMIEFIEFDRSISIKTKIVLQVKRNLFIHNNQAFDNSYN